MIAMIDKIVMIVMIDKIYKIYKIGTYISGCLGAVNIKYLKKRNKKGEHY